MRSAASSSNTYKWSALVLILALFLYGCSYTYLSSHSITSSTPPTSLKVFEKKDGRGHKEREVYVAIKDIPYLSLPTDDPLENLPDDSGLRGNDSLQLQDRSAPLGAINEVALKEKEKGIIEDVNNGVEDGRGLEGLEDATSSPMILEEGEVDERELSELLNVSNGQVEFFIKYFQTKGAKAFKRSLSRSGRYLPLIKKIVKENGLPEEIAYLPFIESGFNPSAHSRAGAVGIWQFMEGTARRYGLRVDWWIDERMDPERSTYAAIGYLKDLYATFGSWPLALTAYNAGEGKVMRAINGYKTLLGGGRGMEDYWEILDKPSFKRETRNYISKFIAAVTIARNPEMYGFFDMEYEPPIAYEKVTVPYATDINVVARAAGVSVEEIMGLNPGLKRWLTPPDYPDYEIKIPYGSKDAFVENISQIPPEERVVFHKHSVKYGETLSHIARRYKTTVEAITYLNRITNPRLLRTGSYIVVPVRAVKSGIPVVSSNGVNEGLRRASSKKITYTVKKGDTLWTIARSFDVDVSMLYQWNGLEKGATIYPGDRITVDLSQRNLKNVTVD